MNKHNQSVLRAGTLALALALSSISHAAAPDRAAMKMAQNSSVPIERVGSVTVGSTVAQAYEELGNPSRLLSQGRWIIFRDFCIDGSKAHGSLVVSFAAGKVSSLDVVSAWEGVALCRESGVSAKVQLVAQN